MNRWLLLSLIALGIAAFFSLQYVNRIEQRVRAVPSAVPMSTVVVARVTIPALTPVMPNDVTTESVPTATVPVGAYSNVAALNGTWTQEAIAPGLPLVASQVFVPKSANVVAARIAPGDMATDVPLSASEAVDGLIEPGDEVSLFTTITEATTKQTVVEDFLNRVRVLGVNGVMTPPVATAASPTAGQGETLILALNPSQIATLLYVQERGTVTAVLDAPVGTTSVPKPYGQAQWQVPIP